MEKHQFKYLQIFGKQYKDRKGTLAEFEVGKYQGKPIYYFPGESDPVADEVYVDLTGYEGPSDIDTLAYYTRSGKLETWELTDIRGILNNYSLFKLIELYNVLEATNIPGVSLKTQKIAIEAGIGYKRLEPEFLKFYKEFSKGKMLQFPVDLGRAMSRYMNVVKKNSKDAYEIYFDKANSWTERYVANVLANLGSDMPADHYNIKMIMPVKEVTYIIDNAGRLFCYKLKGYGDVDFQVVDRIASDEYRKWGKKVLEAFRETNTGNLEEPEVLVNAERMYKRRLFAESLKGTGYTKLIAEYYE